jgi:hypothetical protein
VASAGRLCIFPKENRTGRRAWAATVTYFIAGPVWAMNQHGSPALAWRRHYRLSMVALIVLALT